MTYASILTAIYPLLNASGPADLIFWTDVELYEWAQEAVERLAQLGLFVEREAFPVQADSAAYPLPASRLSVVYLSLNGSALRPASVFELEALSSSWTQDTGTVERYAL